MQPRWGPRGSQPSVFSSMITHSPKSHAKPQGPTCAEQVTELTGYLAQLDKARAAIQGDPLAAREGASMTAANAVTIDAATVDAIEANMASGIQDNTH